MVFIVQYFQCVASGDRWPRAGHDKGPFIPHQTVTPSISIAFFPQKVFFVHFALSGWHKPRYLHREIKQILLKFDNHIMVSGDFNALDMNIVD